MMVKAGGSGGDGGRLLMSLEALGTWTQIKSMEEIRVGHCWSSPDCFHASVRQRAERRHGKMRLEDKREGTKWVSGRVRVYPHQRDEL